MKNYDYKNLNIKWSLIWKKKKYYLPNYSLKRQYCIVIPPPNITGKLHMGHAFQCTLMDILIRYYKMNNYSVLWKLGFDHAGIATQILLEQKFDSKNKIYLFKKAIKWKKKAIKKIENQLSTLGFLLNWDTKRFTLDKHFSYAVKTAFIRLYNEKLIYKATKLVNWDMKLSTAISDLELVYKAEESFLYYIKYYFQKSNEFMLIATTRPETIFADVAIAVNSKDIRYSNKIGKCVQVPLINKIIKIISDDTVDFNFGTGCLKVTPAHDFTDFEIGKKNNLEFLNLFTKDGKLNDLAPKEYIGLTIMEARKIIVKDLFNNKYILKCEKYNNKVPIGDRSGSIIEPYLTSQWYINVTPLILPVKKLIESNKIKILPFKWNVTFISWIENIKDWCISRQIWWGHKIPIWYDLNKNEYIGYNVKHIKEKYKLNDTIELFRDTDVLDTWFSSALWPFASLGWPIVKKEFCKFYPTNTLITGFDIIFFWVIRMLMFGLKFTGKSPFKEIYVHGLIRDSQGSKMSKTKGNVIDPLDIIYGVSKNDLILKQTINLIGPVSKERVIKNILKNYPTGIKGYGIDALRLAFCSLATNSLALNMDIKKVEKFKNFCNKIWNAAKFLSLNKTFIENIIYRNKELNFYILYIKLQWENIKKKVSKFLLKRKFSKCINILYKFFWYEFCDWYIEISKKLFMLNYYNFINYKNINLIFKEFILILHPFAPFITEEIWYSIFGKKQEIILEKYPSIYENNIIDSYINDVNFFKLIINKVRKNKQYIIDKDFNSITIFVKDYNNLFILERVKNLLKLYFNIIYLVLSFDKLLSNNNYIELNNKLYFLVYNNIDFSIDLVKLNKNILDLENKICLLKKLLINESFLNKAKISVINNKKKQLLELEEKLQNIKII